MSLCICVVVCVCVAQMHELSRGRAMHCLPCSGARRLEISDGHVIVCGSDGSKGEGSQYYISQYTTSARFVASVELDSAVTATALTGNDDEPILVVGCENGCVMFYDLET